MFQGGAKLQKGSLSLFNGASSAFELLRRPSVTLDALTQSGAVPGLDHLEPYIKARIIVDGAFIQFN